ncbi:MAG: glycerate kinase [Ruminococcaceae bacterium]|nr:glycerate kinase [Oscillospiraceae bacterium]
MGVETVLDTVQFNEISDGTDTDLVIGGEGGVDSQSLRGKIVIGVDKRTEMLEIPLWGP